MALALIITNFLAGVALVLATLVGLNAARGFLPFESYVQGHVLTAIFAAIMVLFGHCMTMFYFIGTGIRMKELVAEHKVQEDLVTPTKRFKARVFPFATMAMLLTMITFIVGGGVDTARVPGWVHLSLAVASIVLHFIAITKESQAIHANVRLFDHLDEIVVAKLEGEGQAA